MNVDFEQISAPFSLADREKWKRRLLHEEWARKYPLLFTEEDVRLAASDEAKYHFYEWCGAIHLFERYGYLSLVEQYIFSIKHPRK